MPGTQCRRSSRVPLQVFPFPLTEQKKHPRNSYNMEKATPSEVGRRGVGGLPLLFVLSYSTSREEQKSGRHDLDFHLNHLFESYPEFSWGTYMWLGDTALIHVTQELPCWWQQASLWGVQATGVAWCPSSVSMSPCIGVCQCLYKSARMMSHRCTFSKDVPTVLSCPCLHWWSGVRGSVCSRQEDGAPVLWLYGRFCLRTCLYLLAWSCGMSSGQSLCVRKIS